MSRGSSDCKVYIGNLGSDPPSTTEVEKEFSYYGKLQSVWIARRPPGFAYVEFEDGRDARDAVKDLDGRTCFGRRIKVEISHGRKRESRRYVFYLLFPIYLLLLLHTSLHYYYSTLLSHYSTMKTALHSSSLLHTIW